MRHLLVRSFPAVALAAVATLTGCPGGDAPDAERVAPRARPTPTDDPPETPIGPRVQTETGGPEWSRMPFRIEAVHDRRRPTDAPPWHEAGGDWTVLEARVGPWESAGEAAGGPAFVLAFRVKAGPAGKASFGEAMIAVADRPAAIALVGAIGEALTAPIPEGPGAPSATTPGPAPGPERFRLARLGTALRRRDEGGLAGNGGAWTATKWFVEAPRGAKGNKRPVELYANWNLREARGELVEKDPADRDRLVAFLADRIIR